MGEKMGKWIKLMLMRQPRRGVKPPLPGQPGDGVLGALPGDPGTALGCSPRGPRHRQQLPGLRPAARWVTGSLGATSPLEVTHPAGCCLQKVPSFSQGEACYCHYFLIFFFHNLSLILRALKARRSKNRKCNILIFFFCRLLWGKGEGRDMDKKNIQLFCRM